MRKGCILWFTGMSGAGKTTLSIVVRDQLLSRGFRVELLDGDWIRANMNQDLGFSEADRIENVHRISIVAELLCKHDVIVLVAAMSPYREQRESIKRRLGNVLEVYVSCPISVLISRDTKGLYKRAITGKMQDLPGMTTPYEVPLAPHVVVDSSLETPLESASRVWEVLGGTEWLGV